ncbi:alginate lyase family protein [Streptomyces sp. RLB1-33]|uniref:alginate lyase family protein n=1 Tax=Streptomyces mirabilis TaxID=68239 RepID=UPI00143E9F35|nr:MULTISPECIES: alginate lyase family protein [Streptomyces]QIY74213.1 cell wall anchor protein [Streptomyces sp. RLB1-33]QUW78828.1 alginate lyase family protein [Streptomyces mirabilis]
MSRTSPHQPLQKPELSRRGLLRATGGLTAALAVGTGADALTGGTADAAPATFTHPGMLHAYGELNRAKVRVAAGDDPWLPGWNRLTANGHSAGTWTPTPQATIIRGGTGENYGILYNDIHAAYQNALRWKIAGTAANGDTAVKILNAWSAKLTTVTGNADRFLAAGIYGYQFANAAELMRGYAGFDLARFKTMMLDVFYPLNNDFLLNHNTACITNYWANWDLCNMNSILAIGILCDDAAKYDQAVNYFKNGAGNGSISHAIPFVYDSQGLAQYQESGRDQGHTMMGMGQLGAFCEMAWSQGDDLYGYSNDRIMKCAQYVAKYNLGQDVPYATYTWGTGQSCAQQSQTVISSASRGEIRPVWDILYYHYARRRGLSVPYIQAMAESVRPEGGGGDYGPNSGGFDQLGFGTLMYAK